MKEEMRVWLVEGLQRIQADDGLMTTLVCWYKEDGSWTTNAVEAVHYPRQFDAEYKIAQLCAGLPKGDTGNLLAIEHIFC